MRIAKPPLSNRRATNGSSVRHCRSSCRGFPEGACRGASSREACPRLSSRAKRGICFSPQILEHIHRTVPFATREKRPQSHEIIAARDDGGLDRSVRPDLRLAGGGGEPVAEAQPSLGGGLVPALAHIQIDGFRRTSI